MRYDLTTPVNDLCDVQIVDEAGGYTLRSVLVRTALFVPRGSQPSKADKLAAYALAKRIASANQFIDLSVEHLAFLKTQADLMWSPLVLGRLTEMLDSPLVFAAPDPPMLMESEELDEALRAGWPPVVSG